MKNNKNVKRVLALLLLVTVVTGCIITQLNGNKIDRAIDNVVYIECFKHSHNGMVIKLGHGSGVVLSGGRILTNWHVVETPDSLAVTYNDDNKTYAGFVVRRDAALDLALLRTRNIEIKGIDFADSEKIDIGDKVYAIGHPLGLRNTVTSGIVSHKKRVSRFLDNIFIQTDCPINPGSSGGALINKKGELLGITTSFISSNGGFMGYSFSVPSNTVKEFLKKE